MYTIKYKQGVPKLLTTNVGCAYKIPKNTDSTLYQKQFRSSYLMELWTFKVIS